MADSNRRFGALRDRLHFQKRGDGDDGWGNPIPGGGDWATQFTQSAHLRPRTGGEEVTAARLGGRQPYVVTVRNTAAMREITTNWRLVDVRDASRVLSVLSPPTDPDGKRQWLEFLAEDRAGAIDGNAG